MTLIHFTLPASALAASVDARSAAERRTFSALLPLLIVLSTVCGDARSARVQQPAEQMVAGMMRDRALGPSDQHPYTRDLESGAAILGKVSQEGIDIALDVYGPDGRRVARLDNATGSSGAETIDFTAVRSGRYEIVIRPTDSAVYDLWEASLTDPKAVDKFLAGRKGKGPLMEAIDGNAAEVRVTYFVLGDDDTEYAWLSGGPDYMGMDMKRVGKTNLFFATQVVPTDARFVYSFTLANVSRAGPGGEVVVREEIHVGDSVLVMPRAAPQPYVAPRSGVPQGETVQATMRSAVLDEERAFAVYTPPSYGDGTAANLLIVFDGGAYGALPAQTQVPTQTILDNLIAEKKIGPTVAVLVRTMTFSKRNRDLSGSKPFADFIARELVPWVRARYRIRPGPSNVVAAGSSLGGFAATYSAFTHPQVIGNVLSQSGSYWISRNWQTVDADFEHRLYPRETSWLIEALKQSSRLPIRFYVEIGMYDMGAAMLGSNRQLRDVLTLKGYDVEYREFPGGHSYTNWRGTLADGLISLLGHSLR
jgi:enterochelin esterase family protein